MKCILRRHVAAITATTLLAFGFAETADALDDVDTDPLVKESVWYDAENAQLRSVEVKPQVDDSIHRDSRWLAKPQQVREQTAPAATGTGRATGTGYTIANIFGWTLIGVFVVVMTILMFLLLRKLDTEGNISSDRQQAHDSSGLDAATQQRIKHLPAELRRTGVNLRDEAARLMAAEQFDQAMILLFGHQLLLLDRAGSLRLSRGKTNRQYVREATGADGTAGETLRQTAAAFERSYFGRHSLGANEFAQLWALNEELERRLRQRQGAAA